MDARPTKRSRSTAHGLELGRTTAHGLETVLTMLAAMQRDSAAQAELITELKVSVSVLTSTVAAMTSALQPMGQETLQTRVAILERSVTELADEAKALAVNKLTIWAAAISGGLALLGSAAAIVATFMGPR